jgi:hypothetical protein
MALRLACDLDGTLADMDSALQREAERLFGDDVVVRPGDGRGPDDTDRRPTRVLTAAETRQLWEHVRGIENFWMALAEIEPGSVARLAAVTAMHGWEVLFITQRPPTDGETTQVQSQRWLEAHGFPLPSVFVTSGSRGKLAAALTLDAVIDDRPENALDVTIDSSATSILVWRGPRAAAPAAAERLGIHTVYSFAEAVDLLEERMTRPSPPQRLFDRVRSAMGL